ncbi:cobalt-precorrin-6A reductase [Pseudoroseomonas globiformis]|uniref:Cobalt-precorrin-6A reductase n=1 Tax=Teichococcus globiformis TaxID=2307229 RepID=A0ABV7FXS5_9PROT
MRVLLLGGTTEGSALARAMAKAGQDAVLSLAGVTRAPRAQPLPTRIGGFGGVAGLVDYLRAERIGGVIDATHPFAARMTRNAAEATAITGMPLLRVDRPAWAMRPGWRSVASMAEAAEALGPVPRRAFLAVGRKDLAPFAASPWHDYLIRSIDAPPAELLPPRAALITATGPFALEDERRLLWERRIEIVVAKNSGGDATFAKLQAASELGIGVILLARPEGPPQIRTVPDARGALAWLHDLSATPAPGTERGA